MSVDAGLTRLRSPVGDFTPWAGPSRPLQEFFFLALRSHQFRRLSNRRPLFQAVSEGIDMTAYLLSSHRSEVKKAALRVLMTGGAVTQSIAAKWVPGCKTCPHCKLADETLPEVASRPRY